MKSTRSQYGKSKQSLQTLKLLSLVGCFALALIVSPVSAQDNAIKTLKESGKAFASIAKKASPAVVFIKVEKTVENQPAMEFFSPFGGGGDSFGDNFFRRFFGTPSPDHQQRQYRQAPQQKQMVMGQGSGFIISSDGYIMTNNHVVGDADQVTVVLEDGREFKAETVGTDPHSDVAIIKIKADNLPVLPLGDSDALEVGEWVIAVGNPFGLSHTFTAGIVSAKGRSNVGITDYEDFIQTDAAINPGNSGGPLVNLDGKVVGMNTAIASRNGGYMGIGFAIPINMAKAIGNQLIKNGSVTRGYLGILIQNLTPDLADTFGLKNQKGILISQVTDDSPASKAGLKQGDVIIKFDGKPVQKSDTFRNSVSLLAPGTAETITVLRDGSEKTLDLTIGKLPDSGPTANPTTHNTEKLGLTVKTLTRELADQFGYQGDTGVIVTQVYSGSIAEMAGIRPGVLIQEVNRKRVENTEDFKKALAETPEHGSVLLLVKDGQYSRYFALKTE